MNPRKIVLLTGATGFIGGRLLARLLRSGEDVLVLARSRKGAKSAQSQAQERVNGRLRELGCESFVKQVTVVECDLATIRSQELAQALSTVLKGFGVSRMVVVNCAASLKMDFAGQAAFAARRTQDLNARTNVGGLRTLLEVLGALSSPDGPAIKIEHFVHFSTAYVHGSGVGLLAEDEVSDSVPANNAYESTKRQGEELLVLWHANRSSSCRLSVVRPSIVVGPETRDGLGAFLDLLCVPVEIRVMSPWVRRLMGLRRPTYSLLELLLSLAERFRLPVFMRGNPEAILDLIDIEDVARLSTRVVLDDRLAEQFPAPVYLHLSNPGAISFKDFCGLLCAAVGFDRVARRLRFMRQAWAWNMALTLFRCIPVVGPRIRAVMDSTRMLDPYLCRAPETRFDASRTRQYFEQLGDEAAISPIDLEYLRALVLQKSSPSVRGAKLVRAEQQQLVASNVQG